jgi:transposase
VGAGAGNRPGYPTSGGRAAPAGVPDPELVEQAKRRSFTAEYKAKVLARADACTRPGEVGELLRAEGLYTSHLTYWRKQRKDGALKELGKPRGRKPADKRDAQVVALTRRAERAEAELAKMKRVVEIQGKCAARRSVVFPAQPGGTRRRFLGPMALPGSER